MYESHLDYSSLEPESQPESDTCCAQQTGMHRMDGSNCLVPCHTMDNE
jgi:hypothetical protein